MQIAFFGLGNMGGPMACHLVRAGYGVKGYDVVPEVVQSFVSQGGQGAFSVDEALGNAEVVITMLPSGEIAKELYLGNGGILFYARPKTLLIDSSTIAAIDAVEMAQAARERGLGLVDAPVSGGVGGAKAATLTFIVGGELEDFKRAQAVLSKMGKTIFHAGKMGPVRWPRFVTICSWQFI